MKYTCRSTKSPSKFLSLSFLRQVQANYYRSETGLDYTAEEVDSLIAEKENKMMEEDVQEFDEYDFLILEDDNEEIPFPTDSDLVTIIEAEAVFIPGEILNNIAEIFTKTIKVVGKVIMGTLKKARMTATKMKQIKEVARKKTKDEAERGYDHTFDRDGKPLRFKAKPGRKVGELGKKHKIHLSLDPDLYIIASNTGNRSKFINAAVRHFAESRGFREYMATLQREEEEK